MKNQRLALLTNAQVGLVTPDSYNTAWVALVPATDAYRQPAWPQALEYLRTHQLSDGGWGDENTYYAHGQTIATLAALRAFLEWSEPADTNRIMRGVAALHRYAKDLTSEPYQPIGFELLLPRLVSELERFKLDLPLTAWSHINEMAVQKMALIGSLHPVPGRTRSWWFSMEMLPEYQLAAVDENILDANGSIATSPAATAAYLRALRLYGQDSERAASFLEHVLHINKGGAGLCWPIEVFELIWTLDSLRRADFDPRNPSIRPLIRQLVQYWNASPKGLSWSRVFPTADGDCTAVAYKVLAWAGLKPRDLPLRLFWGNRYYLTYPDELDSSVSANVHALSALRHDPTNMEHKQMAVRITEWLRQQMKAKGQLHDKWHYSPFYATSRAIPALAGWDDDLARQCIEFLLNNQDGTGGWGSVDGVNLEETSYAILGLIGANRAGLLKEDMPLRQAKAYMKNHQTAQPKESLWIGKTLYRPIGVVRSIVYAARAALEREGLGDGRHTWMIIEPWSASNSSYPA